MRTISNDQKREVAERLRSVETLEYDGDEQCDEGDALDALGLYNCDPTKETVLLVNMLNGAYWESSTAAILRKLGEGVEIMINDEERRKVAGHLRETSELWRETFPDATTEEEAFGSAIMSDLLMFVDLDYESPVHVIYARLADLIEPQPIDRDELLRIADECEEADVDGVSDWAARIRKAVGE